MVDDRFVLTVVDFIFILDFAHVGHVGQQVPKSILVERLAASLDSLLGRPLFVQPSAAIEFADRGARQRRWIDWLRH